MKYNIMELIFKKLLGVDINLKNKSEIFKKDAPGKNKAINTGIAWWASPAPPPQFYQKNQQKDKK